MINNLRIVDRTSLTRARCKLLPKLSKEFPWGWVLKVLVYLRIVMTIPLRRTVIATEQAGSSTTSLLWAKLSPLLAGSVSRPALLTTWLRWSEPRTSISTGSSRISKIREYSVLCKSYFSPPSYILCLSYVSLVVSLVFWYLYWYCNRKTCHIYHVNFN